ncbi:site-2 protease family protein [Sporosarcina beigongshangi]|uniref:site-2 protease family protein n=1 Tax=Sporosarcina beigongshangi TaxID=2782538 RepID=UPI00193A57E7|nr:site-2 protease family protein [Sporosarcina beigongshangi]
MKFRLHPVLIPLFLFLIMTGDISVYAILFLSLLIHEAGHLIAAYATGMRVRSCIIMPYGGELVISNRQLEPRRNRLIVALGGPLATVLLLGFALWIPFPGDDQVVRIQLVLLALNLLPILPLDGGQAICALLETDGSEYRTRALFLIHSILFICVIILLLICGFPKTLPYMLLALFLLIQNISTFRFRKYEKAYMEIKLKRLT